jgi:hypothetical protein
MRGNIINITKSLLFLAVGIVIFILLEVFVFTPSKIDRDIDQTIELGRTASAYREVIMGDSVCRQLFPTGKGENALYLTSNQATSMVAQYILLDKYISRFPGKVENVIFIIHPFGLTNNLDQVWTYNYFFLPFFSKENDRYFSPLVFSLMKKYRYCFLLRHPLIKKLIKRHLESFQVDFSTLDNTPFDFKGRSLGDSIYLSPVSIEYFKQIRKLCQREHITFQLRCPPLSREYFSDFSFLKKQVKENGLEDLFNDYTGKIVFLDKSAFKPDGIHFDTNYFQTHREELIRFILN